MNEVRDLFLERVQAIRRINAFNKPAPTLTPESFIEERMLQARWALGALTSYTQHTRGGKPPERLSQIILLGDIDALTRCLKTLKDLLT